MTMYVKNEVGGFNWLMDNCWSGAIDTLKIIEENEKEEEFMDLLQMYYDADMSIPTMTELNDFIWFESDTIFAEIDIEY